MTAAPVLLTSETTPDGRAHTKLSEKPGHAVLDNDKDATLTYSEPPAYFTEALNDAERLLKYAAETGVDIDDDTRNSILQARALSRIGWSQQAAGKPPASCLQRSRN